MLDFVVSWPKKLGELMKQHGANGLDAIIDSAGGDILGQTVRLLSKGAKVVCYGMYVSRPLSLFQGVLFIDCSD